MKKIVASLAIALCAIGAVACAGNGGTTTTGSGGSNGSGSGGSTSGTGGSGTGGSSASGTGGSTSGTGGSGTGGAAAGGAGGGATGGAGGGATGGAGGGATGGAGGLPAAAIVVQDNFDTATAAAAPDATKWISYRNDPSCAFATGPLVSAARAHSAPNAALVNGAGTGGCGSFLIPASGFPVTGNAFYVRAFMNWEKATTAITGHGGFIVGATARDNSGTEVRLGISNKGGAGITMMELNLIGTPTGGEVSRYSNGFTSGGNPGSFTGSGFQFAANTWYCVEAFFNGAPAASEFRVWVDGTEVQNMHVTDFQGSPGGTPRTMWAPTYRFLKIGVQDYDSNQGQIWYDDVVVATSRVGCGN